MQKRARAPLSSNALYVLGIIADGPTNPYTICKLINHKRKSFKSPLPLQTVYSTIKTLHKKRLVTCRVTKGPGMLYKTNYSITAKGKQLLRNSVMSYLGEPEEPFSELQLALTIMGHLLSTGDMDKDTALGALKGYSEKMKRAIATGKKLYAEEARRGVADYILMGLRVSHSKLTSERAMVTQFMEKLQDASRWDYSPIPFWRKEVVPESD